MSITSVPTPNVRSEATPRKHQLGLLAAVEQAGREPVAPLDLAQERLAVLRVAHGARTDGEHPLGAECLGLPPVVDEHVAHAGDGSRKQDAAPVDRLAEPGDRLAAHDLVQQAVLDVGDEQAGGVRAEVDGGDSHAPNRTRGSRPWEGSDARNEPEQPAHRVACLANGLELHVEALPRGRKSPARLPEDGDRRVHPVHVHLDLLGGARDAIRLVAERPTCPLELPPEPEPAQDDVRDPTEDGAEIDDQREPESHDPVLP